MSSFARLAVLAVVALCAAAPARAQLATEHAAAETSRCDDCAPPTPVIGFTPRLALTDPGRADAAMALPLGESFGGVAALTLSAQRFTVAVDESAYGVGAGLSLLGVELGGRYLWSDADGDAGLALGGAYVMGPLTVLGGVTLPMADDVDGTSTTLELRYQAAPGVTVGGSLGLAEERAPADLEAGGFSAGMSLRLDF